MPHALLVDDDLGFVLGLADAVKREGFSVATARNLAQAREELARQEPDALLIDLQLPDGSGLDLIPPADGRLPPGVIFITGHASVDLAVEALRLGAADFLTKPIDFARVKMTLANLARTRELSREIGSLRGELRRLGRFGSLVGASTQMQGVYDLIAKVAPTEVAVFVVGETGTGKELVAETVHAMSRRREQPFVPVNCGAIAPGLIESELFGHERGSFTGAERAHRGFFEKANGGTLFLDEITEMPAELQVKLLRVLETKTVERVGGGGRGEGRRARDRGQQPQAGAGGGGRPPARGPALPTQRLPDRAAAAARAGRRRGAARAELPGVAQSRERRSGEGLRPPRPSTGSGAHSWPGNVRELRNIVQRAYIMAGDDIDLGALPLASLAERSGSSLVVRVGTPIEDAERALIMATLEHCAGDKRKAAELLKISLKTLYNRLNVYGAS